MRRWLGLILLCLSGLTTMPVPAAVEPRDHLRVVLDLSKSMRTNDPGQMAILATLLLYDLAQPNTTLGDSFKVIPFYSRWEWDNPSKPPPTANGPIIKAEYGKRSQFVNELKNLAYNADWTHFYPGLRAAVEDLKTTPGGRTDTRTIVLVTDGIPDDRSGTKAKEAALIQQDLLPKMEQHNIRLYVLAFSSEAYQNKNFFDLMTRNDTLGKVFIDPRGDRLLDEMLDLFAASLGYNVDPPQPLSQVPPLDLNKGGNPTKVAVVVLAQPGPPTLPALRLTPSPNNPGGFLSESTVGAAYTLTWVLSPAAGTYSVGSDARQGSVAILRPVRVRLAIRPEPPYTQVKRTMAKVRLPLQVVVNSEYGGDPGQVDINFQLRGPAWEEPYQAPPAQGAPAGAGSVYSLPVVFRENRPPSKTYLGTIAVQARRGAKILGELNPPHSVEVYPFLAMAPFPNQVDLAPQALQRGKKSCARFDLKLMGGYLPEQSPYPIRASLNPTAVSMIEREFNQAAFTLDGISLPFASRPGLLPGDWYNGRPLGRELLLDRPHEICIKVGKPKEGDPAKVIELPVQFTLALSPYDDFKVIEPLALRLRLAKPPLPWEPLLLFGLTLLGAALLWYYRNRPTLAPDLGYAIALDDPAIPLVSHPLGKGSRLARLLGLTVEKPITAEGHNRPLAWVRPVDDELYRLRPARGTRLETGEPAEPVPLQRGLATVSVQRPYRLYTPAGTYRLRLEYR